MWKTEVVLGSVIDQKVDVIVNAANESLTPGAGVCGVIHSAAGPDLWKECLSLKGCSPGEAVATKAYNLPYKAIIHAVGPIYANNPRAPEHLMTAYLNSMRLAEKLEAKSIAFPCISTGVYGYPKEKAAWMAFNTVKDYLPAAEFIKKVVFCCFESEDFEIYMKLAGK